MNNQIKKNMIANFLGRGVSILSIYIFVPFYVNILGAENYGMIGFYTVMQGVFSFANFGLVATLSRELARFSARGQSIYEMRNLVRTLEILFWLISLAVIITVLILAPFIANKWLNSKHLLPSEIKTIVSLMGIAMAFMFPSNLYQGGLIGMQKQVTSNAIQSSAGLMRGGGAVLVLMYVSPTLQAFFLWLLMVNSAEAVFSGYLLWKRMPSSDKPPAFSIYLFKSIWRYATGMMFISINAIVNSQIDKLVVSKLLSLEIFGYYSLASVISQGPIVIVRPVSTAVFPRLTQLVEVGSKDAISDLYHKACQLVSIIIFPFGLILVMFPEEIIFCWTHDYVMASGSAMFTRLLVIGSLFLSLQIIPFNLALANGWTRLNIIIGITSGTLMVPLAIILVDQYGANGAALTWIILNGGTTPIYIYYLHRKFLENSTFEWLSKDVGIPLLSSLIPISFGKILIPDSLSILNIIVYIAILWVIAAILSVSTAGRVRRQIISHIYNQYTRHRSKVFKD